MSGMPWFRGRFINTISSLYQVPRQRVRYRWLIRASVDPSLFDNFAYQSADGLILKIQVVKREQKSWEAWKI
jgi:hypothetical protein